MMSPLQTMVIAVACGAGGLLIAALTAKLVAVRKARRWPSTKGHVVAAAVEARTTVRAGLGRETVVGNYPHIVYEYEVHGTRYQADRLTLALEIPNTDIAATLARYPVGSEVVVFYDPDRPGDAVLERDGRRFVTGIGVTLAVVAGSVGATIFGLDHVLALVDRLLPHADSPDLVVLASGLALVMALAGVAWLWQSDAQRRWPTVAGTVLSSSVERFQALRPNGPPGAASTHYRAAVVYAYEVAGQHYQSNQITAGVTVASPAPEPAEAIVRRYPAASTVTLRYNPRNPAESLLEVRRFGFIVLWLLAALFAAIALSVSGYFHRS